MSDIYYHMAKLSDLLETIGGFQWDAGNASKNWSKHEVSQPECEEVFFNEPLMVIADATHSRDEPRFFSLGRTNPNRLLMVVFTLRGELLRVVSARPMSRRERRIYDDAQEKEDS